MFQKRAHLFAAVMCLLGTAPLAQDAKNFTISAAYLNAGSVYSGTSSKSAFLPSISFENENYKINVQDGISFKVVDIESFKMSVGMSPKFAPYKSSDSVSLHGMSRKITVDATINGAFDIVRGTTVKFGYARELSGEHNGSLLDLGISQFIPIGGKPVIFTLGTKRYDRKLAMYTYGVKASETTANRAAYSPGSTNLTYLSASTFYGLSSSLTAFANVSANFLPRQAVESPIVSKKQTVTVLFGLAYKF